jgi:hypothetical protein
MTEYNSGKSTDNRAPTIPPTIASVARVANPPAKAPKNAAAPIQGIENKKTIANQPAELGEINTDINAGIATAVDNRDATVTAPALAPALNGVSVMS